MHDGQRVLWETTPGDYRTVKTGTVEGISGDVVQILKDAGHRVVMPAGVLLLLGMWEAIDPYPYPDGWEGQAQNTDGFTCLCETCGHQHRDEAAAWQCGRDLAARLNRDDRGVTAGEKAGLTADQVRAVQLAVSRDVSVRAGMGWDELKDQTLAGVCSASQDALIDDWHEEAGTLTRDQQTEISRLVTIYDGLLGTSRAGELLRS